MCASFHKWLFQGERKWKSGMLLLLCRVFITLRGPSLIMHGYMAPQTSQCFTGGENKQHCEMTQSELEKVLSLARCVTALLLWGNSANNSSILIIYLPGKSAIHIHLSVYTVTYSFHNIHAPLHQSEVHFSLTLNLDERGRAAAFGKSMQHKPFTGILNSVVAGCISSSSWSLNWLHNLLN